MRKRVVALLLCAGMITGTLIGCGQTEEKTGASTEESKVSEKESEVEKSSVEEEVEEELVTVTWCTFGDAQDDDEEVMAEINKLLAERYNLQLNLVPIATGEYDTRMQLMSTSGEDYDICFTSDWLNVLANNVAREAFLPLDDLWESDAASILREVYPEGVIEYGRVEGKIYAIPNYQLIYDQPAAYIQKDLADKYGLDYSVDKIDSITDIEWFLEKVRDNEPDMFPLYEKDLIGYAFGGKTFDELGRCRVAYDDADYTVKSMYEFDATVNYYKSLRDYYDKGFIRSDIVTVTDTTADKVAGKYAVMILTGKPGGEAVTSQNYGEEYVAINIGDPTISMRGAVPTMLGINVNSKNPEAAIKMIGVMWSDKEIFNMLLYGLEGEHYKKISENRVELIEDSGYNRSGDAWALGNQFNAWLLPGQEDGVWEETEKINRSAEVSHLAGFAVSNTNIATEVSQVSAALGEFGGLLYTTESFDDWLENVIESTNAAGMDKIVAEYQRQIDEWRKANGK